MPGLEWCTTVAETSFILSRLIWSQAASEKWSFSVGLIISMVTNVSVCHCSDTVLIQLISLGFTMIAKSGLWFTATRRHLTSSSSPQQRQCHKQKWQRLAAEPVDWPHCWNSRLTSWVSPHLVFCQHILFSCVFPPFLFYKDHIFTMFLIICWILLLYPTLDHLPSVRLYSTWFNSFFGFSITDKKTGLSFFLFFFLKAEMIWKWSSGVLIYPQWCPVVVLKALCPVCYGWFSALAHLI